MKQLRLDLGLSQQQIADYLNVHRSVISMAELGKRNFPDDYTLRLEELKNNRIEQSRLENELSKVYVLETIKALQVIIEANNYQIYCANYEISQLQTRLKKLLALRSLPLDRSPQDSAELTQPSLAKDRITLSNRRASQGIAELRMKIALLELKINTLSFERDEAENWVKENEG